MDESLPRRSGNAASYNDSVGSSPLRRNMYSQSFTRGQNGRTPLTGVSLRRHGKRLLPGVFLSTVDLSILMLTVAVILTLVFTVVCHVLLESKNVNKEADDLPRGGLRHLPPLPSTREPTVGRSSMDDPILPIILANIVVDSRGNKWGPLPRFRKRKDDADYGGLEYRPVASHEEGRKILPDSADLKGKVYTRSDINNDDRREGYYAFDDDEVRGDAVSEEDTCRRTAWHRLHHPDCNSFHEMNLERGWYVSHGYYRDVWLVEDNAIEASDEIALKIGRRKHGVSYDGFEFTRMDALVMERLTSSPRIVDIYGFCGLSVATEKFAEELEPQIIPGSGHLRTHELNDKDDVDPQNDFTPSEKLDIALAMSEAIADLHGFKDGVIVHDDIQLSQFLLTKDGRIKLNDFNRAEVMLYDEGKEQYCKYRNGFVYGQYRAPEEDRNFALDEKIDMYSLGNNFYGILTGLWNFYGVEDDKVVQEQVMKGELPFVDPRWSDHSFPESALVTIMERCWVTDPDERASVFEVVDFLRDAVEKNTRLEEVKERNRRKPKRIRRKVKPEKTSDHP